MQGGHEIAVAKDYPTVENTSWTDVMRIRDRDLACRLGVWIFALALPLLACAAASTQQKTEIARTPPVGSSTDCPERSPEAALAKWRRATAPLVSEARKTFAAVGRQFPAGAPSGGIFVVIVLLRDGDGHFQMSYVVVDRVDAGTITGRIGAELKIVHGFSYNDTYRVPEGEILDWGVTMPDGSEKGYFIARLVDTLSEDARWQIMCGLPTQKEDTPHDDAGAVQQGVAADGASRRR